jgi:Tol biopolymer transport system component
MGRMAIGMLAAASVAAAPGVASAVFTYEPVFPAVSPDARHIAWVDIAGVGGADRVFVARPDGHGARGVGPRWPNWINAIAWTRAGIVVDSNFRLSLLSRTGRVTRIGPAGDLSFSVGGSRVASGTAGCGQGTCAGPLVVIDIHSKKQWRLGRADQANVEPALSPNGKQVAWAGPDGILVSAVSGGSPHMLVVGGSCPQWSPDGHSLAYLSRKDSLQVIPISGGASQTLFKRAGGCSPGARTWSPDSKRIVFEPGKRLAIVNVSTHRVLLDSPKLGRIVGGFAWTAGGSRLYVSVRPWPEEAAQSDCTALWLLHTTTLRGKRLLNGCV